MYYIEVTLLPTQEIPLHFLWEKVFYRIHLQLVTMQDKERNVPIGLSFPEYALNPVGLGNKLRVFARNRKDLEQFNAQSVLRILLDYVHVTGIREVPEKVGFAKYERHQPKGSIESLARRRAKRENSTYEDALTKYSEYSQKLSTLPFIKLKSESSSKRFSLFIQKKIVTASEDFSFSTYGLGKGSSVPEF